MNWSGGATKKTFEKFVYFALFCSIFSRNFQSDWWLRYVQIGMQQVFTQLFSSPSVESVANLWTKNFFVKSLGCDLVFSLKFNWNQLIRSERTFRRFESVYLLSVNVNNLCNLWSFLCSELLSTLTGFLSLFCTLLSLFFQKNQIYHGAIYFRLCSLGLAQ